MAYNDKYVAVWDRGGLDMSQGAGNPCGGSAFAQYASCRPGGTGYIKKLPDSLSPERKKVIKAACSLVGKDTSGNILVVHCSSSANNVVITSNSIFGFAIRPSCY